MATWRDGKMWPYTKATQNRVGFGEHSGLGLKFFKSAGKNFLLLQVLFLGLFAYVFGALFQQSSHMHNITIAFVDYDGGAIGAAVKTAYGSLSGDAFPTLVDASPGDLPNLDSLASAVCGTDYWASLSISAGASGRLQDALAGRASATPYNTSDVLTLIWNEARYSTAVDAAVLSNVQTLSEAARIAYGRLSLTGQNLNTTNPDILSALVHPWTLTSIDLQPTGQGSRAIYNTLVIILILIQEFFYLGTINGIYAGLKVYNRIRPQRIIVVRVLNSLAYCMVGSLCTAGMIWAFRSGWNVSGSELGMTWVTLWLFAHLNFLVLDVFTIWLPPPYVPMALISWVVFNVTSILLPFELSPGFYHIGYMFPAHDVYETLLDIWSHGCNPHLRYTLPIMFAWELAGLALSALGVFRRSHYATIAEEQQAAQFKERLDVAVAFEQKRDEKRREEEKAIRAKQEGEGEDGPTTVDTGVEDDGTRREVADVIEKEVEEERMLQKKATKTCNFGPVFELPFEDHEDKTSNP